MLRIFDPIEIGSFRIRNRLVMPPMRTGLATFEGEVTSALVNHYVQRSKVPGLIIVEHAYVLKSGRSSKDQLGIYNDKLILKLKKLVSAVHNEGASIAIQINHGGAKTSSKICGQQPIAPSPINLSTEQAKQLTISEIKGIVKAFVQAAQRAFEADFDAVEVHGAHGYLLNQFNSPLCNARTDEYGGNLKNRIRISVEILKKIKDKVGKTYPLLYRLGADDFTPGGLTIEESMKIAPELVRAGVDILDISGGLCGIFNPQSKAPGFFVPLANKIKQVISVPVIGVGGIETVHFADELVKTNQVDLVAVGRALLNDPNWGVKEIQLLQLR